MIGAVLPSDGIIFFASENNILLIYVNEIANHVLMTMQ